MILRRLPGEPAERCRSIASARYGPATCLLCSGVPDAGERTPCIESSRGYMQERHATIAENGARHDRAARFSAGSSLVSSLKERARFGPHAALQAFASGAFDIPLRHEKKHRGSGFVSSRVVSGARLSPRSARATDGSQRRHQTSPARGAVHETLGRARLADPLLSRSIGFQRARKIRAPSLALEAAHGAVSHRRCGSRSSGVARIPRWRRPSGPPRDARSLHRSRRKTHCHARSRCLPFPLMTSPAGCPFERSTAERRPAVHGGTFRLGRRPYGERYAPEAGGSRSPRLGASGGRYRILAPGGDRAAWGAPAR